MKTDHVSDTPIKFKRGDIIRWKGSRCMSTPSAPSRGDVLRCYMEMPDFKKQTGAPRTLTASNLYSAEDTFTVISTTRENNHNSTLWLSMLDKNGNIVHDSARLFVLA